MASTTPFRALPAEFRAALHAFAQSSSTFRILRTVRSSPASAPSLAQSQPQAEKLHVLDSSFNPPTLGHLGIVLSALREEPQKQSKHVLLLLATQNADKAPKPAAFEMRLTMMTIMAESILSNFQHGSDNTMSAASDTDPSNHTAPESPAVVVSIGVTKHPYFIDKSHAIADTSDNDNDSKSDKHTDTPYPFPPTHQVHLIGFDTFTRLLDPQYYPPEHTLAPLEPLFANHSVRVTFRSGDKYGSKDAQQQYVRDIAEGKRATDGAKTEWAEKVSLVEGRNDKMVTSSTAARDGAKTGDWAVVQQMCDEHVAAWVQEQGLYTA